MKDNEQTTYSEMEFNAIMENCKDNFQHSLCLKILCNFGLTISEAINIKNKDIDLEKKEIKIYPWKKCFRSRALPIPEDLLPSIRIQMGQRDGDEYFLVGRKNSQLHPKTIEKILIKTQKKLGIRVTLTKIRQTVINNLIGLGWGLKAIRKFLGHARMRTIKKIIEEKNLNPPRFY